MKYAVIARPPVTGGKNWCRSTERRDEGLRRREGHGGAGCRGHPKFQPLGGVAVIARTPGAAIKGRDALKIVWDDGANAKYESAAYRTELEEAARKPGSWCARKATWTPP